MLCNDVRAAIDKVSECICDQGNSCVASDCLIASFYELREAEVDLATVCLRLKVFSVGLCLTALADYAGLVKYEVNNQHSRPDAGAGHSSEEQMPNASVQRAYLLLVKS